MGGRGGGGVKEGTGGRAVNETVLYSTKKVGWERKDRKLGGREGG